MSAELTARGQALAYVRTATCRFGPPRLIGAELEWGTALGGMRPASENLAAALGSHAPPNLRPANLRPPGDRPVLDRSALDRSAPEGSASGLPLGSGALVSVEPGGQIELASEPHHNARDLCDALTADHDQLRALLSDGGIEMLGGAMDLDRPPRRILGQPRYAAMERRFAGIGQLGAVMMCNTASVQVSVDCGRDGGEAQRRWALLHEAGPALSAAFADSPRLPRSVSAPEPEGWASQRLRTWLELDPGRTGFDRPGQELEDYADWVLAAPLLCVRRDGEDWTAPDGTFADWIGGALDLPAPRAADLDYHLTTLFPPVRARGHFEVRYLDAQPGGLWRVPIAAVDALLRVIPEAREIAAPTAGRWYAAARHGLGDLALRDAATELLELAAGSVRDAGFAEDLTAAALRCKRGLRPSEEAQQ